MATVEEGHGCTEGGGLNIAMDEIMDVITLYKCKFCSFSCGQPADIRQHVQDFHVVQEVTQDESTHPEAVVLAKDDDDGKKHIETVDQGIQGILEEHHIESVQHVDIAVGDDGDQPVSSLAASGMAEEYQKPEEECYPAPDELAEDDPDPDTQVTMNRDLTELYLCGQCNLGFDSIENCKSHIVKDHHISLEEENGDTDGDDNEAMEEQQISATEKYPATYPEKISVGTQVMSRKKPGRKKKVREESSEENPPVEEVYEEEEAAVIEEHRLQQQEEILDNAELEMDDGKTRRKRRLPSRLTQLYYVGKPASIKRTIVPAKKIRSVPLKMVCPRSNCSARFRTSESVDIHVSCHKLLLEQGRAREAFLCIKCQYNTTQWKVMRMHLWREHNIDTDLFCCGSCDFKSDTLGRVERHSQIHGDARPYICGECGKGFKQLTQLHNHKMTHLGKKADPDRWYSNKECDICHRTFANQKCLKNHIEIVHTKEKPFVCPYCNHATSRKAILDLHIRTHTGEKPFKCDMCAYVTGDHNSLRRHRMRHTGEKPYKCKYCKYSAIQAISLKTHLRNKHPGCEGVFACDSCPYRTVNEQHFNNHLQDHKNGLITNVQTVRKPAVNNAAFIVNSPRSGVGKSLLPALSPVPRQILTLNGQPISAIQLPAGAEVQTLPTSEMDQRQGNSVLLSKVANLSMVQGDVNTARIIYTALGALSNKGAASSEDSGQEGLDMIGQPTVQSATQDGVTTHTITFHIPPQPENADSGDKPTALQVENYSQIAASTEEGQIVSTQVEGATIEEGQVLLALHAHDGNVNDQEHLKMEGTEVVYTTEVSPDVGESMQTDVLVCDAQETMTMEVSQCETPTDVHTSSTTITPASTEVVPIDITETTVVEINPNSEAMSVSDVQSQAQDSLVMNLISKEHVTNDSQVQYITISQ